MSTVSNYIKINIQVVYHVALLHHPNLQILGLNDVIKTVIVPDMF